VEERSGDVDDDALPDSRTSVGGIVAILGGVLISVGTLFEMVSATVGSSGHTQVHSSQTYLDTDDGKVVLVLGLVVVVLAALTSLRRSRSIVWPIVSAACSLAAIGLAVHDRIDLDDLGNQIRNRYPSGDAATAVVHVTVGPALYIVIAGGVLATIGALLAARDV
jgi:hypothetical protein